MKGNHEEASDQKERDNSSFVFVFLSTPFRQLTAGKEKSARGKECGHAQEVSEGFEWRKLW